MAKRINPLEGSLWDKILAFALPLAATSIIQQLFNSCDVATVGQFSGSHSLAAVGSTAPITNLFITIFVGFSVGANVIISRFLGAQREDRANQAIHTALVLSIITGFIVSIIGEIIARPLLELMSTPTEVLPLAVLYLRVCFIGMFFLTIYNFESAILRAGGDTKRPLYCLIISGTINVVLNLVFVILFKLDVAGVALATTIADATSSLLLFRILYKEEGALQVRLDNMKMEWVYTKEILIIGIPAAIQGMLFNISNIIIQSAINSLGADIVAASTVALNFEMYSYFLVTGFAQAAITFTSQNYGAKNYKRCIQSIRWCMLLGALFTGAISALFVSFSPVLSGIFTSDPAIVKIACIRISIVVTFEVLNMTIEIMSGALRGLGNPMISTVLCIIFTCTLRLAWIFIAFARIHTFQSVLVVYPISWAVTSASIVIAYLVVKKKKLTNV